MSRPSAARLGPMPTFPEFYEALNEQPPFPWQTRLAEHVARKEHWPTEIGVPTGLGKTTCLDIAVWWLASQADRLPRERKAPTRIWWLVNRRLLVDSTADHARRLRDAVGDSDATPLRIVGERLRSLGATPSPSPIDVVCLRGGVEARLPSDPSRPAILLSTIPMYGSRLLFRGYGTSRTMRPIDAALAGSDSLLLVDEAHLARHLVNLISALADCTEGAEQILGGSRTRPQVTALTATGDAEAGDRFDLDADDEQNEIVQHRLDAGKPTEIRVKQRDSAKQLARAVEDLLADAQPSSCLVFANTPDTARAVFTQLRKKLPRSVADTVLLTGRTRERERQRIRERIMDCAEGMSANREVGRSRARHLIVVATQTLEVGADIDAEYVVTEACGVRALTQRLGRLNRLGHHDHARGVYVHVPPRSRARKAASALEWPVYGTEPETVLRRLQDAMDPVGSSVDLSPRRVGKVLGEPGDDPGRAPEVLMGLLWEWVKTTTPPAREAPVEPYFSGISGTEYAVSVLWRAHVPEAEHRLWPRPFDHEAVSVPLREVRESLGADTEVKRLRPDQITVESVQARDLSPGNVILLPADRGLLDEFGWNPDATAPVVDVSIAPRGLPLDEEALQRVGGISLDELVDSVFGVVPLRSLLQKALGNVPDDEELEEAERQEAAKRFHRALFETTPLGWEQPEWHDFLRALDSRVVSAPGEVSRFALGADPEPERRSDEFDETSLGPTFERLDSHGSAVGVVSRSMAKQIGLSSEFTNVIHLAGQWHDVGKADVRFQRWLDPRGEAANGRDSPLLAKSRTPKHLWNATREAAGWPRGGRHEALSARLVQLWTETTKGDLDPSMADLLIHLVASHHGRGRPVVPPAIDSTPETVTAELHAVQTEAPAGLSLVDWDQPARFRRLNEKFGPWGLALLETILRCADHSVSAGMPVSALETDS